MVMMVCLAAEGREHVTNGKWLFAVPIEEGIVISLLKVEVRLLRKIRIVFFWRVVFYILDLHG